MPSFNRVTLLGNLTRDPQIKHLPSSTTVADFGLAMSRRYRTQAGEDREEVCFVDCSAFGKQAEVIAQYCKKGRPLFIEGRLKFDQWDDKTSGARRSKISVVVENFQFLGGRDEDPSRAPATGRQQSFDDAQSEGASAPRKKADKPVDKEEHFTEADIPF
jgi:single-strand DNA-binding protein